MFEKIKDFIYDISDYLVTIIIIFFIVISIAFVMTKSYGLDFSKNDLISIFSKEEITEVEAPPQVPEEKPTPPPVPEPPKAEAEKEVEEEKEEPEEDYILYIEPGDDSNAIGARLENAGVLEDAHEFALTLVDRDLDTALQIGEYTFKKKMTLDEVIEVLFP